MTYDDQLEAARRAVRDPKPSSATALDAAALRSAQGAPRIVALSSLVGFLSGAPQQAQNANQYYQNASGQAGYYYGNALNNIVNSTSPTGSPAAQTFGAEEVRRASAGVPAAGSGARGGRLRPRESALPAPGNTTRGSLPPIKRRHSRAQSLRFTNRRSARTTKGNFKAQARRAGSSGRARVRRTRRTTTRFSSSTARRMLLAARMAAVAAGIPTARPRPRTSAARLRRTRATWRAV